MRARIFLLVLLMQLTAAALNAATWYGEYDAGLKAIAAKDWKTAEARLRTAMQLQPKQGRQVLAYGIRFIKYVPQYYLGLTSFQQGKYQESMTLLQNVQKVGLVAEGDPEYPQMVKMIQQNTERVKPNEEEKKLDVPAAAPAMSAPKAVELPATELESQPAPVEAKPKPEIPETLIRDINAAVAAKKFLKAKKLLQQATAIDAANPDVVRLGSLIAKAQRLQDLEDRGLLAFLSGDYSPAALLLERVTQQEKGHAEAWFYLGCTHAAQGLLQGAKGESFLMKARNEFAQVHKLNANFKHPQDLISPRILELYRQAQ